MDLAEEATHKLGDRHDQVPQDPPDGQEAETGQADLVTEDDPGQQAAAGLAVQLLNGPAPQAFRLASGLEVLGEEAGGKHCGRKHLTRAGRTPLPSVVGGQVLLAVAGEARRYWRGSCPAPTSRGPRLAPRCPGAVLGATPGQQVKPVEEGEVAWLHFRVRRGPGSRGGSRGRVAAAEPVGPGKVDALHQVPQLGRRVLAEYPP